MKFLLLILALQVAVSGAVPLTNGTSPGESDVAFAQVSFDTIVFI